MSVREMRATAKPCIDMAFAAPQCLPSPGGGTRNFRHNRCSRHATSPRPPLRPGKQLQTKRGMHADARATRQHTVCSAAPWGAVDVDAERDQMMYNLEAKLAAAVKQEKFQDARSLRDEITKLQSPVFVDVLQAHLRFYNAILRTSITDMARIWSQDGATCKHPGGEMFVGYSDVLRSFDYLFSIDVPYITPRDVRISVRGSIAYVTCDEILTPRLELGEVRPNFQDMNPNFTDAPAEIPLNCINIFIRRNGEFQLTHHSAGYRAPIES